MSSDEKAAPFGINDFWDHGYCAMAISAQLKVG
jgi:hypothetical protein